MKINDEALDPFKGLLTCQLNHNNVMHMPIKVENPNINITIYAIGEPRIIFTRINSVIMNVGLTSALVVVPYLVKKNQLLQRIKN